LGADRIDLGGDCLDVGAGSKTVAAITAAALLGTPLGSLRMLLIDLAPMAWKRVAAIRRLHNRGALD